MALAPSVATAAVAAAVAITTFCFPLGPVPISGLYNIWLASPTVPGLSMGLPNDLAERVAALPAFLQSARITVEPRVWELGPRAQQVATASVTPAFFRLLRLQPAAGRFGQSAGVLPYVVVGWEVATSRLGGPRNAVGRRIRSGGVIYTVAAVAPRNFGFPNFESPGFPAATEIWVVRQGPLPDELGDQTVLARLRPGLNTRTLEAELHQAAVREQLSSNRLSSRLRATTVRAEVTARSAPLAIILLGTGALVLLVGVVIAALSFLGDAIRRLPEVAVRASLGASPARLLRDELSATTALLVPLVTISAALAAGGLRLLEIWSPDLIVAAGAGRVLVWALATAAALATLGIMTAALLPAVSVTSASLGGRPLPHAGRHPRSLGPVLVICGLAFATLSLYAATLFLVNAWRVTGLNTGMQTARIAAVTIAAPADLRWTPSQRTVFLDALLLDAHKLPGVAGSVLSGAPVLAGAGFANFSAVAGGRRIPATIHRAVAPGYFKLLHVALLRGRAFTQADTANPMRQAIISRSLAQQAWPQRDPVGQEIEVGGARLAVIGVAADTRDNALLQHPAPEIYTALAQGLPPQFQITLLMDCDAPARVVRQVDHLIWARWPQLMVLDAGPLANAIARAEGPPKAESQASTTLAILAMVLGALGLFAWLRCEMQWRRRELAVRVACGASPAQITALGLRKGVICWAWGAGLGLTACAVVHPLVAHLLYEQPPLRAGSLAGAAVLAALAAVAASLIPAWRASRVPPAHLLRE